MDLILTVEQILGLAANQNLIRSTRAVAVPEKWTSLGRSQTVAWGTIRVINRPPFEAAIHLTTFAATCSCTSRQNPCNHSLALLLLANERPNALPPKPLPEWAAPVTAHGLPLGRVVTHDPLKRLRTVRRGLADLERWLHDMIRAGLAQLPAQPKGYWEAMAARLVDTRCPKLAQTVRDWHKLLDSEPNWAEQLVRQLGQTQLLIDAFQRFELLSAETQTDLCLAVGWQPDSTPDAATLHDRWHVVGSNTEQRGRRRIQHTWLSGVTTRRYAHLSQYAPVRQQPRQLFVVGTSFEATLRFLPSTAPLQATFETAPTRVQQGVIYRIPTHTIAAFNAQVASVITRTFWHAAHPVTLHPIHALYDDDRWHVVDADGYQLPLPPDFAYGWHLMALHNVPLFGVWDGLYFRPMSLRHNGQWLELRLLTEVRA